MTFSKHNTGLNTWEGEELFKLRTYNGTSTNGFPTRKLLTVSYEVLE